MTSIPTYPVLLGTTFYVSTRWNTEANPQEWPFLNVSNMTSSCLSIARFGPSPHHQTKIIKRTFLSYTVCFFFDLLFNNFLSSKLYLLLVKWIGKVSKHRGKAAVEEGGKRSRRNWYTYSPSFLPSCCRHGVFIGFYFYSVPSFH